MPSGPCFAALALVQLRERVYMQHDIRELHEICGLAFRLRTQTDSHHSGFELKLIATMFQIYSKKGKAKADTRS